MLADSTMPPIQLPYDLERTIIEYAAEMDQQMALKLMLVSREVQRWIEPVLYRHIQLKSSSQADALIRTLDSLHPESPNFFANTIKSISFAYGVTFHQASKILSICKNITSLSTRIEFSRKVLDITLDDIEDFRRFMTTQSPTLRRLSVTLQPFFLCPDPSFRAPIIQNLTHLSVFGASEHCHKWSWIGLENLKYLTHFALEIDTMTSLQAIYNFLPRLPSLLRVCLVVVSVKEGRMSLERYLTENHEVQHMILGDTDQRIVVGTTEQLGSQEAESWGRGLIMVHKLDDPFDDRKAWDKAESVIISRRRRT